MDIDIDPADVRRRLQAIGVSQNALARAAHVWAGHVSEWLGGKRNLSRVQVVTIIATLEEFERRALPTLDGRIKEIRQQLSVVERLKEMYA